MSSVGTPLLHSCGRYRYVSIVFFVGNLIFEQLLIESFSDIIGLFDFWFVICVFHHQKSLRCLLILNRSIYRPSAPIGKLPQRWEFGMFLTLKYFNSYYISRCTCFCVSLFAIVYIHWSCLSVLCAIHFHVPLFATIYIHRKCHTI